MADFTHDQANDALVDVVYDWVPRDGGVPPDLDELVDQVGGALEAIATGRHDGTTYTDGLLEALERDGMIDRTDGVTVTDRGAAILRGLEREWRPA